MALVVGATRLMDGEMNILVRRNSHSAYLAPTTSPRLQGYRPRRVRHLRSIHVRPAQPRLLRHNLVVGDATEDTAGYPGQEVTLLLEEANDRLSFASGRLPLNPAP